MKERMLCLTLLMSTFHLVGQELEWKAIGEQYALFDYAKRDLEGNVYCIGKGASSEYIGTSMLVTDRKGQIIFDDTLFQGLNPVVYVQDVDSSKIRLITEERKVYSFNKNEQRVELIDTISELGIGEIQYLVKSNDDYVLVANNINGNSEYVRARVDASLENVLHREEVNVPGLIMDIVDNPFQKTVKELYSGRNGVTIVCRDYRDSILWVNSYGGDTIDAKRIIEHPDGTIFLLGNVKRKRHRLYDFGGLLVKLNNKGTEEWRRVYFRPDDEKFVDVRLFFDIILLENGNMMICGTDGTAPVGPITNMYLTELDTQGVMLWDQSQYIYGEGTTAHRILNIEDGYVYTTGTCGESDYGEPERLFVAMQKIQSLSQSDVSAKSGGRVFPNPVTSKLVIEGAEGPYHIFDVAGNVIQNGLTNGYVDVESLPSGAYYLTVEDDIHFKFVKN